MQLLSPGRAIVAAAPPTPSAFFHELLQSPEIQQLGHFFFSHLLAGQVVAILAYWLASKAVAEPDKATLPNALKLWISYMLFLIVSIFGVFVVVGLVGVTLTQTRSAWPLILTIGALAVLLFLFILLFIPMNIYSIGIIRAFGFRLMAGLISFVAMLLVDGVLAVAMGEQGNLARLQRALTEAHGNPNLFLINLKVQSASDEIDRMLYEAETPFGSKPSLKEREAMIVNIQQKLSARKAALAPGDAAAQAAFQKQLNRYMRFRASVISEMQSQPATAR